jgi:hypothetical protein
LLAWWTWWYQGFILNLDGMQFWPPIFLTDITQFLLAHGDVALTNDMLKDYKVGKASCIHFIPCSARTISSFCQTIIFFGAISIHCGGHHPVSMIVNTLFLKYTSCCCSTVFKKYPSCSHPLEKYS